MMKIIKIAIAIALALFIMYSAGQIINSKIEQGKIVDQNGRLLFQNRGDPQFTEQQIEETQNYKFEKIIYDSKGTKIYAHLYKPDKNNAPAVIIIPAARAAKEGQADFAKFLISKGYAVLIIDQRGVGETQWTAKDQQEEFDAFMQKKELTTEQLMAYDVLKAFDVMQKIDGIDKDRIILEGESMGGRFATIAAALEPKVKGLILISSAGYGTATGEFKEYVDTINPDHYIGLISPRKIVMFHSAADTVIPAQQAYSTFQLAKDPKELIAMPLTCKHGNCDEIHDKIAEKLSEIQNS